MRYLKDDEYCGKYVCKECGFDKFTITCKRVKGGFGPTHIDVFRCDNCGVIDFIELIGCYIITLKKDFNKNQLKG